MQQAIIKKRSKLPLMIGGFIAVLVILFIVMHMRSSNDTTSQKNSPVHTSNQANNASNQPAQATDFDKTAHSRDAADSLWVVVNKHRQLQPKEYTPKKLVTPNIPQAPGASDRQISAVMAPALEAMAAAAKKQGITLTLASGYRSYTYQVNLYKGYVQRQGQKVADSQSARAGYSEHQTGLAADLGGTTKPKCNIEDCYTNTPEGKWLAAHAYEYGFLIRYPADKTPVTGYKYEPWHVRYVGSELSKAMHEKGSSTLEEFFGLEAAPDYK